MSLHIGSLFAGIGGLELGLERAGLGPTVWQVESDDYCWRVLATHWPDAARYGDVRKVDFASVDGVDVLVGGFPCQDISIAGRREGISGERSGLWADFARAVRDLRPGWVVVENVRDLTVRGLDRVLADLAVLGYDAEWQSLPAAAVGAPHIRWRVFVVAYPRTDLGRGMADAGGGWGSDDELRAGRDESGLRGAAVADPDREGQPQQGQLRGQERRRAGDGCGDVADADGVSGGQGWSGGTTEGPRRRDADRGGVGANVADAERGRHPPEFASPIIFGGEAASALVRHRQERGEPQWAVEPHVGRVADGVPARVDRLRTLGNAVVPQVAEFIGCRILAAVNGLEPADA